MKYRLFALPLTGIVAALGGTLVFGNLNDNLVYYLTPAEAAARASQFDDGQRFRLGGLVEDGSVRRTTGGVAFVVIGEDGSSVPVMHTGAPAQLFQPGIGVVLEGAWLGDTFDSDTMIIKHDENYRPPEEEPLPGTQARSSS